MRHYLSVKPRAGWTVLGEGWCDAQLSIDVICQWKYLWRGTRWWVDWPEYCSLIDIRPVQFVIFNRERESVSHQNKFLNNTIPTSQPCAPSKDRTRNVAGRGVCLGEKNISITHLYQPIDKDLVNNLLLSWVVCGNLSVCSYCWSMFGVLRIRELSSVMHISS